MKLHVRKAFVLNVVLLLSLILLAAQCAPAPEKEVVEVVKTVEVEKEVEVVKTVVVEATPEPEKEPIRVGIAMAFSGSMAWSGEAAVMGATVALEELDWQIAGHPIELYTADNACNPDMAISAFRKLADVDKVDVILGSGCSSGTLAVMPLLPEAGIPQVSTTNTNPKIADGSGPGRNDWQFHVNADDRMIAQTFAPYIAEEVDSIAFLSYSDDFGRGVVDVFKPMFEDMGVDVGVVEYYDRGAVDMRPALIKIKEADPEGLFLVTTEHDAVVLLRQLRELDLPQKIYVRGTFLTNLFLEMTEGEPGLAEGVVESSWWGIGMDPEFDKAFQARWGTAPTSNRALPYYGVRYILKDAIERADATGMVDRASIREALTQVSVDTPIGMVEFDDHHQSYPNMSVATMRGGEIVQEAILPTIPIEW